MTQQMMKDRFHDILKNRIDELCDEREMSYYVLAYKASLPMSTMVHIMDGTSMNPGIFTIMKICDGLGVTLKEFFDTKEFEEILIESRDEK